MINPSATNRFVHGSDTYPIGSRSEQTTTIGVVTRNSVVDACLLVFVRFRMWIQISISCSLTLRYRPFTIFLASVIVVGVFFSAAARINVCPLEHTLVNLKLIYASYTYCCLELRPLYNSDIVQCFRYRISVASERISVGRLEPSHF